jgi:hypothetical protein
MKKKLLFSVLSFISSVSSPLIAAEDALIKQKIIPTINYSYSTLPESEQFAKTMVLELEALTLPYLNFEDVQKAAKLFAKLNTAINQNLTNIAKTINENSPSAALRNALKIEINKLNILLKISESYQSKCQAFNILETLGRSKVLNQFLVTFSSDSFFLNLQGEDFIVSPLKSAMNLHNEVLTQQLNFLRDQILRSDLPSEAQQSFKNIIRQLSEVTSSLEREYMANEVRVISQVRDLSLYQNTGLGYTQLDSKKSQIQNQLDDMFKPMAQTTELLQKFFKQLDDSGWNGKRAFPKIITGYKCVDLFIN